MAAADPQKRCRDLRPASASPASGPGLLRSPAALLVLCIAVAGAVGWPTLTYPFGRDQAIFAYVGDQWRVGHMPYRDAWDNKPPAQYALAGLSIAAFGHSQKSLRIADLILTLCIVAAMFIFAQGVAGPPVACVTAIVYTLAYYLHFDYWNTAQSEVPTSLFGVLALIAASRSREGASRHATAIIAGACVGASALFKITGAFILPLVLAMAGRGRSGRWDWRHMAGPSAMVSAGFALPLVIVIKYFEVNDALLDIYDIVIKFNINYAGQRVEASSLQMLGSAVAQVCAGMPLAVPLALVGLVGVYVAAAVEARTVVVGWFALCVVMVFAQHRFFWYHWLAVLPPLALLAGIGAATLVGRIRRRGTQHHEIAWGWVIIATMVLVAIVLHLRSATVPSYVDAVRFCMGRTSRGEFEASFQGPYRYSYAEGAAAATYLREHTLPTDTIAVWGFEPEIHFLARRRAPSRFVATHPLSDPELPYKQEQWRQEFLSDCLAAPPAYFLMIEPGGPRSKAPLGLMSWPDLARFIEEGYAFERRIGQFKLFRRRDEAGGQHHGNPRPQ